MTTFAERCRIHDAAEAAVHDDAREAAVHDDAHEAAVQRVLDRIAAEGIDQVRIGWCDLHGLLRGKTLTAANAVERALREGIGMVSTVMLKDTADRTAYDVFAPGGTAQLPGFGQANNLVLLPDPQSFVPLPWSPGSASLRAQAWFADATPVPVDTRRVLQRALARLAERGLAMRCGLEVEFHIYRIRDASRALDPMQADRPAPVPEVDLIHPGYQLLGEAWYDRCEDALRIVQRTAQGLGLPLTSLEIELGPSQVEAVFEPCDALSAADRMVAFRNGVTMALRRAGYHATFMCRPPFANIMSSGWHLHQSLVDAGSGENRFARPQPAPGSTPLDASNVLSDLGESWLAGLLEHARAVTAIAVPTINGFARFQPNALAPQSALWGRDNRGAMLRVVGDAGDESTRIENRIAEPAANPYLTIAAQLVAGLDGVDRGLRAPPATQAPYAAARSERLPSGLADALNALRADAALAQGLGSEMVALFDRVKRQEIVRHAQAQDVQEWERREYFGRL
jgi:glutamine synthetase